VRGPAATTCLYRKSWLSRFSARSHWLTTKKDPDEIGNRDVGKGVNFYSLEKEIALGKQLAQEVERQAKIVDDPVIAEYVNRVGQNLVRNSDAKVPFTIKVLDSEEVNAFALPGGFFFVNSGLVLARGSPRAAPSSTMRPSR
jgi:predicted Zn-dependent protease